MKMARQKFTVILMPDGDGYQVIVPHYPDVISWGQTPKEAFEMAQECLELVLEIHAETHKDPVIPNVNASHVIVGTVEAEVPEALMSEIREYEAEMENRKPEEEREREAAAMFAKEGVR